jgi:photosystem II stability/assembly factor-like uncharacterized protein
MHIIYSLAGLWHIPIISVLLFQLLSCNQASEFQQASQLPDGAVIQIKDKAAVENIVFKSTNGGLTWQETTEAPPEVEPTASGNNIVKSEGVLLATGQQGIRRSTDNGEHWQWVISEGGVGIAIEPIKGGFAAITYNTETKSRRIRISMDNGKTWQAIDEGLPPSPLISSVKQMGNHLICGHPDGIFISPDMGKTWKSVHPGVDNTSFTFSTKGNIASGKPGKVFRIYVSGNVLYAVAVDAGC